MDRKLAVFWLVKDKGQCPSKDIKYIKRQSCPAGEQLARKVYSWVNETLASYCQTTGFCSGNRIKQVSNELQSNKWVSEFLWTSIKEQQTHSGCRVQCLIHANCLIICTNPWIGPVALSPSADKGCLSLQTYSCFSPNVALQKGKCETNYSPAPLQQPSADFFSSKLFSRKKHGLFFFLF